MPKSKKPAAPGYTPPPIDQNRLYLLYDSVLAGMVVTTNSIEEFCALIELFERDGRPLLPRTEWEVKANPWLFKV